ncbi:hypothetical protein Bca4012_029971 [Brassica carinata]|uniref:Uncharacterized protein n=1 Tax=Brassica carinata TaxID=52824 RepID=A0A8X7USC5_BRACI|nr:hypothetical protein Bca52824_048626 [Brassica carinata]
MATLKEYRYSGEISYFSRTQWSPSPATSSCYDRAPSSSSSLTSHVFSSSCGLLRDPPPQVLVSSAVTNFLTSLAAVTTIPRLLQFSTTDVALFFLVVQLKAVLHHGISCRHSSSPRRDVTRTELLPPWRSVSISATLLHHGALRSGHHSSSSVS